MNSCGFSAVRAGVVLCLVSGVQLVKIVMIRSC
jgi:hypothetical protein